MFLCSQECPVKHDKSCCFECDRKSECEDACKNNPNDCEDATEIKEGENPVELFKQGQMGIITKIATIVLSKKKLDEQEKQLKQQLQEAMEKLGVKKFDSDVLSITYVAATTQTTVDSKKLKEKHPAIYTECSKTGNKSAYVKIDVK